MLLKTTDKFSSAQRHFYQPVRFLNHRNCAGILVISSAKEMINSVTERRSVRRKRRLIEVQAMATSYFHSCRQVFKKTTPGQTTGCLSRLTVYHSHRMRLVYIVAKNHYPVKHIYQHRVVPVYISGEYFLTQSIHDFFLNQPL